MIERYKTKQIFVGNVPVGGDAPISVQSMTYSETHNVAATVEQINRLHFAGCDIVRVAVPNEEDALALKAIKEQISLPLVADIHFNYKLALIAAETVDCVRFNPGNIGEKSRIKEIVKACQERNIPIRVGVNAGSLEKEFEDRYGQTAEGMVASAEYNIKFLEDLGFDQLKVSLKASDVSISGELEEAINVGKAILKDSGAAKDGLNIISCPTCGRIEADLVTAVAEIEEKTKHIKAPLDVSVMGCVVNAIGEAKHADVAIAYGKGSGLVMVKGDVVARLEEKDLVKKFVEEVEKAAEESK
jgi:(E)-4-hydroxy-3-methylbut-2-enyl-diphosphate synthase